MKELTVFCVSTWDKYPPAYVYALKEMVAEHLTISHEFKCITTQSLVGIDTVRPPVPFYGWWSKIGLFYKDIAKGPSIYFDLDVVLTGNIDYLADYTDTFSAPANWAKSGHGGIQSSVMCWPGSWHLPYEKIRWPEDGEHFYGDQEYMLHILKDNWVEVPHVGSYKYHIRPPHGEARIPDWMRVCVFHGQPKPHEVTDKCLLPYISTQLCSTKGNIVTGSLPGSKNVAPRLR